MTDYTVAREGHDKKAQIDNGFHICEIFYISLIPFSPLSAARRQRVYLLPAALLVRRGFSTGFIKRPFRFCSIPYGCYCYRYRI